MLLLRSALETLAAIVEAPGSLTKMVAELERSLGLALHPVRVKIFLADEAARGQGIPIPLRVDGHVVGTMLVAVPSGRLDPELIDVLRLLAAPIGTAIGCLRRPDRRGNESRPGSIDALCQIPNRRGFDERLAEAWQRALGRGVPLVLALIDVDFFKVYNDRYGHVAGDQCLQQVAALLAKRRDGDDGFAARYGGEEFALVFEDTSLEAAIGEVEHLFERLAKLDIEHAGTTLGRVSLSVGLAATVPSAHAVPSDLIEDADRALYQAKHFGRNRICAGTFVSKNPVVAKVQARLPKRATADVPTFGRADDLARILAALRYARVMTLVGPRGIGKSRLLSLLADAASSRLHRSVVFLEAELLRAEIDPATALASACDLTVEAGGALNTVTDYLADRDAVLIFDDVEHARGEIRAMCNHLIARTSGVSIVAGASANLGVPGERSIVVAPLDDEAALDLLRYCGIDDGPPGRELLRYLGGTPGSIKLAAEWVERLGILAVLERFAAHGELCADPADVAALFAEIAAVGSG